MTYTRHIPMSNDCIYVNFREYPRTIRSFRKSIMTILSRI